MADISSWNIHGTSYDLADATARANFAAAYDSTATYAVGDYCTHNGALYVCNTAISTAEAWTAAHWTETVVGDELTELKSAITGKQAAPAAAGTVGQVLGLDSNLDPVWVNQTGDPADIAAAVDAWCDENITNPDSPPLDRSLTASSAAAPADIVGDIAAEHVSTNLYDKSTCNPADGYMYNKSGVYTQSALYACSGKIPVSGSTQYIFGAGNATVHTVRYFSGDSGGTYIDGETISGASFTTPANCTFIAINLFAKDHSTDDYNSAINAAQLNTGSTLKPYEPFGNKYYVPLGSLEDGEKMEGIGDDTSVQSQVNMYDKTLAENGKYYYQGTEVQTSADYAISGKIPVYPSTQYCISESPDAPLAISGVVYEYDESGEYLGTSALHGYVYGYLLSFATSPDTHYVAFNMNKTSHTVDEFNETIDTLMLTYGTMRPHTYSAYNPETVVRTDKLDDAYFNPDCFSGKTWLATGTSITWYDGKAYQVGLSQGEICRGYIGNVSRRKRLLVINDGISGSTLGNVNANSLINRYQSLDWANVDIATLEYGVNDLGNNVTVGTASDAAGTDTFAACLKTVIEYALAQNPTICLVICTEPDVRGTNTNTNGNTLKDFTDVTLEIAAQYRLPVCDWYYHSGINAQNKGDQTKDWMTCDGTHPSDAGHLRMAAMLNQVFDSLIC